MLVNARTLHATVPTQRSTFKCADAAGWNGRGSGTLAGKDAMLKRDSSTAFPVRVRA